MNSSWRRRGHGFEKGWKSEQKEREVKLYFNLKCILSYGFGRFSPIWWEGTVVRVTWHQWQGWEAASYLRLVRIRDRSRGRCGHRCTLQGLHSQHLELVSEASQTRTSGWWPSPPTHDLMYDSSHWNLLPQRGFHNELQSILIFSCMFWYSPKTLQWKHKTHCVEKRKEG